MQSNPKHLSCIKAGRVGPGHLPSEQARHHIETMAWTYPIPDFPEIIKICGLIAISPFFIVLAWICWAVDEAIQYMRPRNISKRRQERPARAPVALPRRRRALSMPLPEPRSSKEVGQQRTSSQQNSYFFRLPAELRDIIYRDILELPAYFHVWRTHKRLCSISCTQSSCSVDQVQGCNSTIFGCRPLLARDGSAQRVG